MNPVHLPALHPKHLIHRHTLTTARPAHPLTLQSPTTPLLSIL
ncbi:MAG: hypothetical protein WAW39_19335 [Prosthecobacter sp.]